VLDWDELLLGDELLGAVVVDCDEDDVAAGLATAKFSTPLPVTWPLLSLAK
jgi:hypothetical protein